MNSTRNFGGRDLPESGTGPLRASTLVEHVGELEAFEQGLASELVAMPPLRLHRNNPHTAPAKSSMRRWWMSFGGLAVAASLLVAITMSRSERPNRSNPMDVTGTAGQSSESLISQPADPHATVLLTIVEGSDPATGLACASCRTVDLVATDGRDQTLLAHAEPKVIQDAMNRTCSPTATRVVVLGLTGPSKSLPSNEAQASQLAQCIMSAPGASSPGGDASLISNAASACMPDSVSVRVYAASR